MMACQKKKIVIVGGTGMITILCPRFFIEREANETFQGTWEDQWQSR